MTLFTAWMRSSRRWFVGWLVGLSAFTLINVYTYPAVRDQPGFDEALEGMPDALLALFGIDPELSLISPEGYLISQMFGFLVPLLLAVAGVTLGARAIAGEEEQGTLELVLSHPVTRARVVAERLGATLVLLTVLAATQWGLTLASAATIDMRLPTFETTAAWTMSLLFGMLIGSLGLAVGAAVGRRGIALSVAIAVAVAGFVMQSLGEIATALGWLRAVSPFHYVNANDPLINGFRGLDVAVLLGLTVIVVVAGMLRFARRDLVV